MYCLGDWRSETRSRSPRARRSRSRWRILSRSSATDFMRDWSLSVDSSGMASVSTVAIGRDGGQHHRQKLRVVQTLDQESHGAPLRNRN